MVKLSIFKSLLAGALFLCAYSMNAENLAFLNDNSQDAVEQSLDLNDNATDNFYGYGGYGLGYSGFEYDYALRYFCFYLGTCGGFGPYFGGYDDGYWSRRGRHHKHHKKHHNHH